MANKKFIVKNGLDVTGDVTVSGTITGDGSGLSGVTSYTVTNFDSDLGTKTTDDLTEGSNQYFTTARARNAMVAGSGIEYDSATGVISTAAGASVDYFDSGDFDIAFAAKTTDDLTQGSTNLYYDSATTVTTARNSMVAGTGITYTAGTGTIATNDGAIVHDNLSGFVANEHVDHSTVTITAGAGLTGGGDITATRTLNIGAGTGVTVNADDIAIGQSVGTTDDVTFAKITGDSADVGQVSFQTDWTTDHINFEEGALWYDPYHKTLNFYTDVDHPMELGMQVVERVYNNTGSQIDKGKPVYYSGNRTNEAGQESPTVALADATSASAYNVQGLAAENIANGAYGHIVVAGVIDGIDTSSLTAGQNVFAGLTPGALQNASPVYPNYPMCLGWVITSDSSQGKIIINQQNHSVNSFRVQSDAHVGNDLIVGGNLTVTGTQTVTSTANVQIGGSFQYLNAGDTIGEANTTFVGSGLDDAFFSGHYSGDSSSKSFYVKIDATGTPDTFEWGHDSTAGAIATGIAITGAAQMLDSDYGISIDFGATTGHTLNDVWAGSAAAVDTDTGFFTNRNTGDAGTGYTHLGFFFDVSTNKWRLVDVYDPEPEGAIDIGDASISYGDLVVNQVEGNLVGNVTGTVSDISNHTTDDLTEGSTNLYYDSATTVTVARNAISVTGDLTYTPSTGVLGVTVPAGYSSTEFDSDFGTKTTDDLTQGSTNLYYDSATTVTVARNSISAGTGIGYSAATGQITSNDGEIVHNSLSGYVANEHVDHSGVSITAGTGLSGGGDITTTRTINIANTGVSAATYGDSSTIPQITVNAQGQITAVVGASVNIPAGYGQSEFDADFAEKTTADLTELTNLYYTDARARAAVSVTDAGGDGSLGYNSSTGVITYTGPSASEVRAHFSAGTGIGLASGVISNSGVLSVNGVTGAVTAGNLLTALLTVDGTGTGLDADLLDGQEGSYYRIDVYNSSGTLLN